MGLVTGQILTTPTTTTPTTTTQTHPPTTSTTSTTTTTTLPTTTSASTTTTPPTTSEVPGVLNLTYLEQVKVALTVDPKETSGTCFSIYLVLWFYHCSLSTQFVDFVVDQIHEIKDNCNELKVRKVGFLSVKSLFGNLRNQTAELFLKSTKLRLNYMIY